MAKPFSRLLRKPRPAQAVPTVSDARLHLWIRQFGYNTNSFLSLYPGMQYFTLPGKEGFIPYVTSGSVVLAAGDPICALEDIPDFIREFTRLFSKRHKIAFVAINETIRPVLEGLGFDTIYIGREPIFDLNNLPTPIRSIRQAMRRAERKGLKVVAYEPRYRDAVQKLCNGWLDSRELPPMAFLFQLRPFDQEAHKKFFLLVDENDDLLAFLACSPIYARNGWYLEDLIRRTDIEHFPNGGTELLLLSAMDALRAEGYEMATLALAPLSGLNGQNRHHPIINQLFKLCYEHLSFIYHFQTLEYFKTKFQPNRWEANYFCVYPKGISFTLVRSVISGFMPSNLPQMIRHKISQSAFALRRYAKNRP